MNSVGMNSDVQVFFHRLIFEGYGAGLLVIILLMALLVHMRKKLNELHVANEERDLYEHISDNSQDMLFVVDLKLNIKYINRKARAFFQSRGIMIPEGASLKEVVVATNRLISDDRQLTEDEFINVSPKVVLSDLIQVRNLNRETKYFYKQVTAMIVKRQVQGTLVVLRDVTEDQINQKIKERVLNFIEVIKEVHATVDVLKLTQQYFKDMLMLENVFFAIKDEVTGIKETYFLRDMEGVQHIKKFMLDEEDRSISCLIMEQKNFVTYDHAQLVEMLEQHTLSRRILHKIPEHLIGVPLKGKKGVFGAIGIASYSQESFSKQEIAIFNFFSSYIGMIIELKMWEESVQKMALYDYLTKLPNRVSYYRHLEQEIVNVSLKNAGHIAVFYLDLDGFKEINDMHGHEVGDRFIVAVADRLKKMNELGLYVSRIGGDEFTAAFNYMTFPELENVANGLIELFGETIEVEKLKLKVTASIGISCYPEHGETAIELLNKADQSLYQAKHKGKNQYHIYTK